MTSRIGGFENIGVSSLRFHRPNAFNTTNQKAPPQQLLEEQGAVKPNPDRRFASPCPGQDLACACMEEATIF